MQEFYKNQMKKDEIEEPLQFKIYGFSVTKKSLFYKTCVKAIYYPTLCDMYKVVLNTRKNN